MDADDWAELIRRAQEEYESALRGDRPVFCMDCGRPFRARRGDVSDGEQEGAVYPFRHARAGVRFKCPGSHRLATLSP